MRGILKPFPQLASIYSIPVHYNNIQAGYQHIFNIPFVKNQIKVCNTSQFMKEYYV